MLNPSTDAAAGDAAVGRAAADAEHVRHLQHTFDLAQRAVDSGLGGPFGALVVLDGEVIAEGWNQVTSSHDPTAHAEVTAIRAACARLGTFQLTGAILYASCEPCPMCLGAAYWARPAAVYFAASRQDAAAADFSDAMIYDEIGLPPADRTLPFRRIEVPGATDVFRRWLDKADRTDY